ncbi:3-methyl-2-oxobutanoate hydroxymethyltransferase [Rothia nasimurium]|uniref:3-methyl-2-oxobutanoate hydroxymethyltransferase n=1 Tax=Rothia nasimurium TaxID=85336 RepID=A0A4Y9F5P6_9MICC|nr:3-methyl-2-oxobutanoate hydroxymethyltransferase [Rothia nasimurium]MBF0807425.1 3-methyl-2-oxobutanoate hydroxymethyltransferase [Rothia nasimurium]TFU23725.1 3-methyl-2-oxobutanoate hydroxymethyltransferase [Rothia nasimurium]
MLNEETAPYGSSTPTPANTPQDAEASVLAVKKVRTVHLQQAKDAGEKFAMLTSYDALTATIFDRAGIELLLIGDSAGNNVLGQESTLTITVDEMIPLVKAVSTAAKRAMVVADLPFGSYEQSPAQAVATAVRFMKEGGAHAVKMEATAHHVDHVRAMVAAGIPVIAHIGFTPQSEHALGGYRVQGRDGGQALKNTALALEDAGAFCLLMEMTRSDVAADIDASVRIPIIGIGAGADVSGQVLVWQDAFGLRQGKMARFVKQYANLYDTLLEGAAAYRADVRSGTYPAAEHRFDS